MACPPPPRRLRIGRLNASVSGQHCLPTALGKLCLALNERHAVLSCLLTVRAHAPQTELTHRGSKFYKGGVRVSPPAGGSGAPAGGSGVKLRCSDCAAELAGTGAAEQHAKATGHKNFEQVK